MGESQESISLKSTKKSAIFFLIMGAFLLGRATVSETDRIKFVKGKPIVGLVDEPVPESETETPEDERDLPMIRDTIYVDSIQYVTEKVDMDKVLSEFTLKRRYEFTLYDDMEVGKLDVSMMVQNNKLQDFKYTNTPYVKNITTYKEKYITPFASLSYHTVGSVGIGGGAFIRDIGVEYQFNLSQNNNTYHTIGLKYKF